MLSEIISVPRAWDAASLDDRSRWYFAIPADLLAALERTLRELPIATVPVTSFQAADSPCGDFGPCLEPVREALQTGRGFVIIDGISPERFSTEEMRAIYWLLGQLLGRPMIQNVQGTLLYDVRDTGQSLEHGARFSVTSYESSFHTDNSFGESVLDTVGLLCLQSARSGGLSQVVSGYAVHNRLLRDHADVLPTLYQPFQVERRGGVRAGEGPAIPMPIFAWDGADLIVRYLRYWIQAGHEKIGKPLTSTQVKALDVLDNVLAQRDLVAEFMLQPGQMFFINNRTMFHNRTAFDDWPQLERRRHYLRLWLQNSHA
ncbi:MAG TPA: TauD/TfdA family dioxygenase [Gemmataceae bacterium]|nr:TauD/TfdA family dioxygenase [Gemmataceae bacterium]